MLRTFGAWWTSASMAREEGRCMRYDFTLILAPKPDLSESAADALFEAGCDDCTPGMSNGVPLIYFHREAANIHEAIRSAVADVHRAGCKVSQVRIEADAIAEMVAAEKQ
jgi:hypothetical protein